MLHSVSTGTNEKTVHFILSYQLINSQLSSIGSKRFLLCKKRYAEEKNFR